jgi:hypothetical protein
VLAAATAAIVMGSQACIEDDVLYGEVGGLRRRPGGSVIAGQQVCPIPADTNPNACPDWATQVFPIFDRPAPGLPNYGCMIEGVCHGPGGEDPVLVPNDPSATYDILAGWKDKEGTYPYIGENLEDTAYILCNLDPTGTVNPSFNSALMPQVTGSVQRLSEADFQIVAEWVACGMQKGPGMAAGAGGMGGTMSAGGAGGGV